MNKIINTTFILIILIISSCTATNSDNNSEKVTPKPSIIIKEDMLSITEQNLIVKNSTSVNVSVNIKDAYKNPKDTVYHISAVALDNNGEAVNYKTMVISSTDIKDTGDSQVSLTTFNMPQSGHLVFSINGIKQKQTVNFYIASRKVEFSDQLKVSSPAQTENTQNKLIYHSSLVEDAAITFAINHDKNIIIDQPVDGYCHFQHDGDVCNIEYHMQKQQTFSANKKLKTPLDTSVISINDALLDNNANFINYSCSNEEKIQFLDPKYTLLNNNNPIDVQLLYCNPYKNDTKKITITAPDENYLDITPNSLNMSNNSNYQIIKVSLKDTISDDISEIPITASIDGSDNTDKTTLYREKPIVKFSLPSLQLHKNGGTQTIDVSVSGYLANEFDVTFKPITGITVEPSKLHFTQTNRKIPVTITINNAIPGLYIFEPQQSQQYLSIPLNLVALNLNIKSSPDHINFYREGSYSLAKTSGKHFYVDVVATADDVNDTAFLSKNGAGMSAAILENPEDASSLKTPCTLNEADDQTNRCKCKLSTSLKKCVFIIEQNPFLMLSNPLEIKTDDGASINKVWLKNPTKMNAYPNLNMLLTNNNPDITIITPTTASVIEDNILIPGADLIIDSKDNNLRVNSLNYIIANYTHQTDDVLIEPVIQQFYIKYKYKKTGDTNDYYMTCIFSKLNLAHSHIDSVSCKNDQDSSQLAAKINDLQNNAFELTLTPQPEKI